MRIGAFGDLVFEVSEQKILTFDNWQRTTKHRYQKHNILNHKPKLESVGSDLEEITLEIYFSHFLNVSVKSEMEKLRKMCDDSAANFLIIGGEVVGDCLFVIEEISESVEVWGGSGQILSSRVKVKFKEFEKVGDF